MTDSPDIATILAAAAERGVTLDPEDITRIDGELSVDGMNAAQWLDAMTLP